jgi:hypothetical protein
VANVEEAILSEAREEVGYADHKASMVLASLGIGFGALIGGFFAGSWRPSSLVTWGEVLWWAAVGVAGVSVVLAASAVWPRYRRPEPEDVETIHYWGDVAAFDSLEALSAHLRDSPIGADHRTREQMWQLSRIVSTKYRLIRRAFIAAGVAVLLFGVSAISKL